MLEHALAWAARGFRVFPLSPGEKVPPKGMHFKTEATLDPDKIRAWWQFEARYNIGVACGDGLLVVDVDSHKNGFASLMDLDLPSPTLTVRTPGGGVHIYFRGPDVQNSVDRIGQGLDIRSAGGYVVAPGSYFADPGGSKGYKGFYTVEVDAPAALAPEALVLIAGEPRIRDTGAAVSIDSPDDIIFAIHYLLKDAPVAIEGRGGNNTTYAVAARLTEIGVSAETAASLMAEHWNERCSPPWTAAELLTITTNAQNYAQTSQGSGGVTANAADFEGAVAIPPPTSAGKFDNIFARRTLTAIEAIPARAWVVHRLLLRGEAAILTGPGGVGKSGLSLALAAHGAVGRPFAGYHIDRPFKTIVYNLEDSRHEMEARLYATCAMHNMDPREVEKHVLLWPGRELRFRVMDRNHAFAMADIKELARLVKREGFDAMVLDPLISIHHEEENDNSAMGDVMDAVNGLAQMANIGVLALHHSPKGARQTGSAEAARGAGNIINSVRIAATIYAADEADAQIYGFTEGYRAKYVRLDDAKMNSAALETRPVWLEKQGFPLPSGDSTYALRSIEASASVTGEARLIATVLHTYMERVGTFHLGTHDAAKVLTETEAAFRERVPASGNLSNIKALIEMRLAEACEIEGGVHLQVQSKTEPGKSDVRRFVTVL